MKRTMLFLIVIIPIISGCIDESKTELIDEILDISNDLSVSCKSIKEYERLQKKVRWDRFF